MTRTDPTAAARPATRLRQRLVVAFAGLAALLPGSAPAQAIPVDDSYTVSRRVAAYRDAYPMLRVPVLRFERGERLLVDRLYKTEGERELHLDVFLPNPRKANGKGVMLVHGGGWRSGTKAEFYPLANLLAHRGYAVFLPEYRLSPEAGYPAGLDDLRGALEWVRANAQEFGVKSGHLSVGGGSSGGHLAALLAYSAPVRPAALVDLDGVLDLTDPLALQYENASAASSAVLWLGGRAETHADRWREASPATHAESGPVPTLVISSGQPRYTAGRDRVFTALGRRGVRHDLVVLDRVPHTFWLFDPWLERTAQEVDRFLRESG